MNYFSDLGINVLELHGFEEIGTEFYISDQLSNGITVSPDLPVSQISHILCCVDENRRVENDECYKLLQDNKAFGKYFVFVKAVKRYVLPA